LGQYSAHALSRRGKRLKVRADGGIGGAGIADRDVMADVQVENAAARGSPEGATR
jgi:hypothetical protein